MKQGTKRFPHNIFKFYLKDGLILHVSSQFSGGNLHKASVIQVQGKSQKSFRILQVKIQPQVQPFNPSCSLKQSNKSFFNFSLMISHLKKQSMIQVNPFTIDLSTTSRGLNRDKKSLLKPSENLQQISSDSQNRSLTLQNVKTDILKNSIQENLQSQNEYLKTENLTNSQNLGSALNQSCSYQPPSASDIQIEVNFIINKFSMPNSIDKNQLIKYYRPCIKKMSNNHDEQQYDKLKPQNMIFQSQIDGLGVLKFSYLCKFTFPKADIDSQQIISHPIFFAYHYPYNNHKLEEFLTNYKKSVQKSNKNKLNNSQKQNHLIYYNQEVLIQTQKNKPVYLLSVTCFNSQQLVKQDLQQLQQSSITHQKYSEFKSINLVRDKQPQICQQLFPQKNKRPYFFNKPIIFITCRVHPGQTSASYALNGLLTKLIDGSEQSMFLLKIFTFKIIPILNPDGVQDGTYRMNPNGQNLNRYYGLSDPKLQPTIFAAQKLIKYYSQTQKGLRVFFDFHGHARNGGSFLYGNSHQNIHSQIQTELFCEIMQKYDETFSLQMSSFCQKNMNAKDNIEILSKNGSARIYAYRCMKEPIHCYTLQTGYIAYKKNIHKNNSQSLKPLNIKQNLEILKISNYLKTGQSIILALSKVYRTNLQNIIDQNAQKQFCQFTKIRQNLAKKLISRQQKFKQIKIRINKIDYQIEMKLYSCLVQKNPSILNILKNQSCKIYRKQCKTAKNNKMISNKISSSNHYRIVESRKFNFSKELRKGLQKEHSQSFPLKKVDLSHVMQTDDPNIPKQKYIYKHLSYFQSNNNNLQIYSLKMQEKLNSHKQNDDDHCFLGNIGRSLTYSLQKKQNSQIEEKEDIKNYQQQKNIQNQDQLSAQSPQSEQKKYSQTSEMHFRNKLHNKCKPIFDNLAKKQSPQNKQIQQKCINTIDIFSSTQNNAFLPKISYIKGNKKTKAEINTPLRTISVKQTKKNNFNVSKICKASQNNRKISNNLDKIFMGNQFNFI